jgi:four helix bundle protein
MLKSFRELEVWQKTHALVLDIYRVTDRFPDRERFGITSQLRRAATSVPANIAEGFARRTTAEFLQFLGVSNASLEEARYFLLLSRDLCYLAAPSYNPLEKQADSIAQMLAALSRSLRNRSQFGRGTRNAGRGSRVAGPKR